MRKKIFNVLFESLNGETVFCTAKENEIDSVLESFDKTNALRSVRIYAPVNKTAFELVVEKNKRAPMGFRKN